MDKKLQKIISQVFNLNEEDINEETSQDNVPEWTSVNALLLITELEKEFNVVFNEDEITMLTSVKNITEILQTKNL